MYLSTLTSKSQTTIPKEIRILLHLKPNDTIVYVQDGKRVFLTPVQGNILDLKGAVRRGGKGPADFAKLRDRVKAKVAKGASK